MRVDQHADHAQALVVLDEPHAAHVAGEVIDGVHPLDGLERGIAQVQIRNDVFGFRMNLIPLLERLDIDTAHLAVSLVEQFSDQMPADESAPAANNRRSFHVPLQKTVIKNVVLLWRKQALARRHLASFIMNYVGSEARIVAAPVLTAVFYVKA